MSNFSAISWREQDTFNEIRMSTFYLTNTFSFIVLVLAHWNNTTDAVCCWYMLYTSVIFCGHFILYFIAMV